MMLLDDELRGYEAIARDACAGLASTITSREFGLQSPEDGSSWLDIAIAESSSTGDPRQNPKLTIDIKLTTVVRDQSSGLAYTLCRWLEAVAMARMIQADGLRPLFVKIVNRNTEDLISNLTSTPVPVFSSTTRVERSVRFWQPTIVATGISTQLDAEGATGHAFTSTTAKIVTFERSGPVIGPYVATVIYAGADGGDTIEILDSSGAVHELIVPATLPTGMLVTSALPAGVYAARLATALSPFSLAVSERP